MGNILFATPDSQIESAMVATLNAATGNFYLNEALTLGPAGSAQVMINAMGAADAAAFAASVMANLGITTASVGAANVSLAQGIITTIYGSATAGADLVSALTSFSAIPASDATWGAVVSAYNTRVNAALQYSLNTANTSTDLNVLMAAVDSVPAANSIMLTTGLDAGLNFHSFVADTIFTAPIIDNLNTFQSGDSLIGTGTGNVLDATLGNSQNFAIQATTHGIQTAQFEAQATATDAHNNNIPGAVQVDARSMPDVTNWVDANSRADLNIESIALANAADRTSALTFTMRNTDAGNAAGVPGVSYKAYIDPQALRIQTAQQSGTVTIVAAGNVPGNFTAGTPDKNFTLTSFAFNDNGTIVVVPLDTVTVIGQSASATVNADFAALYAGGTVPQMNTLITDAVAAYNTANGTHYTVTVNTGGSADFPVADFAPLPFAVNSYTIGTTDANHVLSATATGAGSPGLTQPGWVNANPDVPTGGVQYTMTTAVTLTTDLITANVVLDHVGQGSQLQDPIYNGATGSAGGDMVVGSMATSGGVERLNVSVQNGSWINSLSSTNNTLQVVNIASSAIASPITTAMANSQTNGQFLAIGGAIVLTANAGDLTNWNPHGLLVNPTGLTDVQTIDATAFTGSLFIGSTIDTQAIDKYLSHSLNDVNFAIDLGNNTNGIILPHPSASFNTAANSPVSADLNATFNSVNQVIAPEVAASGNALFTITGGTSNDAINLTIGTASTGLGSIDGALPATTGNWILSQETLNYYDINTAQHVPGANAGTVATDFVVPVGNITINAATGNNVVSFNDSGTALITAGTGNDAYYVDNSGFVDVWVTNANATASVISAAFAPAAAVVTAGVVSTAATAATQSVTWHDFIAAGTESIGGVTVTATGPATAAQIATLVANSYNGASGNLTVSGEVTGAAGWDGSAANGGTDLFTYGTTGVWAPGALDAGLGIGSSSLGATQPPTAVVLSIGAVATAGATAVDTVTWSAIAAAAGTVTSESIGGVTVTDTAGVIASATQVASAAAGIAVPGLTVTNAGLWTVVNGAGTATDTFTSVATLTPNNIVGTGVGTVSGVSPAVIQSPYGNYTTAQSTLGNAWHQYHGVNETITVSYDGYTTALAVPVGGAGSTYTTGDVNNAIVEAINGDATMSALLHATSASGGASLIINSLIDGAQQMPQVNFIAPLAGSVITGVASGTYTAGQAAADLIALGDQGNFQHAINGGAATIDGAVTGAVLTGTASAATNNSVIVDAGSTNVVDLSSSATSFNTVVLSGQGAAGTNISYIVNADVAAAQNSTFDFVATTYGLLKTSSIITAAAPTATPVNLGAGAGLVEVLTTVNGAVAGANNLETDVYATSNLATFSTANATQIASIVGGAHPDATHLYLV